MALVATVAAAAPPAPQRWVTDGVGFLSPSTRQQLDARLGAYERRTGHQVIVWIGGSIGGDSLERWAADTFKAWGIGGKGKDDGLALFILAQDRRMRIEVGYGLEGEVPDVVAAQILREELTPRLQQGDRDGAVVAAVNRLLLILGGEAPGAAPEVAPVAGQRPLGKWELGGLALLGFFALLFLSRNPRLAGALLYTLASSGRHGGYSGGGFSGGGGGFSGGGGRSGGGGASGSW